MTVMYVERKVTPRFIYFWPNRNILLSETKNNSVSRAKQQAALRHIYSASNTIEQIYDDRSSEHNKATLLTEIICRNRNSPL